MPGPGPALAATGKVRPLIPLQIIENASAGL